MLVRYIVILLAVGSLASCAVLNKVESARTLDIYGPGVIQNPVIADLDVLGTKVSGIATGSSSSPSTIKNMALADAIKKAKADVLVQPAYEMETIRGKTTATVTGFPANYKNFRSATSADSLLIKTGYMHRANVSVADDTQAKKKGGGAIAVVLTLVLVAVVAALAGGF